MIPTMLIPIIDEMNAIVAIGFSGTDCDIIIVTIALDIAHVIKSDFNDMFVIYCSVLIYDMFWCSLTLHCRLFDFRNIEKSKIFVKDNSLELLLIIFDYKLFCSVLLLSDHLS